MKIFVALCTLFLYVPIWYYLIYQILIRVEASELMWFLFWVYLPVGIFCTVMNKVLESKE